MNRVHLKITTIFKERQVKIIIIIEKTVTLKTVTRLSGWNMIYFKQY